MEIRHFKKMLRSRVRHLPLFVQELLISAYVTLRSQKYCRVTVFGPYSYRRAFAGSVHFDVDPTGPRPEECRANLFEGFCWRYRPQPGDVVIDVGAGVGAEVLEFSRMVGGEGLVLALEPHPEIFNALQRTVSANHLTNVVARQLAVSRDDGRARLQSHLDDWQGNSLSPRVDADTVEVATVSLDQLLKSIALKGRRIALLKMNIEGGESDALFGFEKGLSLVDHLAISCHDFKGQREGLVQLRTYVEVEAFLVSMGFQTFARGSAIPHIADIVYAQRIAKSTNSDC